ncbi:hypothetical protein Aconfl_42340 [Algoriphagus confluentis]|uniref:Auto-transporter adhesin head GIN domain-containing protein n=2 Tax=Algoriphagus confluentis TaxID=1697556 RepID=A0ABQ6PUD9_9BACT|nr:hypothetical protein Aconfl_42340 [Algoriphagus confluentis]
MKMKTSNKILFSFLLFAWVSIMATLLVSFRYSELRGLSMIEKMETKTWEIAGEFSVVSISDSWVTFLDGSAKGQIKYLKVLTSHNRDVDFGDPDPFSQEVRNDTLFIKGMRQKPNGNFSIQVAGIKSIIMDQVTEVRLRKMALDSLKVISTAGELVMEKDHGVKHLDFEGKNESSLLIEGIESLNLLLDQSKADLQLYLGGISGQVINRSEVTLPSQSGAMNLSKDKTSKILVEDEM